MPYKNRDKHRTKSREWNRLNAERKRATERRRRESDKFYSRKANLKANHGLTLDDYQRMFDAQAGLCKICKRPERNKIKGKAINMPVDHCHKTKKIRGLLCSGCNRMLGFAEDNILILESAVRYLRGE